MVGVAKYYFIICRCFSANLCYQNFITFKNQLTVLYDLVQQKILQVFGRAHISRFHDDHFVIWINDFSVVSKHKAFAIFVFPNNSILLFQMGSS